MRVYGQEPNRGRDEALGKGVKIAHYEAPAGCSQLHLAPALVPSEYGDRRLATD